MTPLRPDKTTQGELHPNRRRMLGESEVHAANYAGMLLCDPNNAYETVWVVPESPVSCIRCLRVVDQTYTEKWAEAKSR